MEAGFLCWMAPGSIPGGAKYATDIPQAIRNSDVFVVVLSNKTQQSLWVPKELNQAINTKKKIMPFFIEDCSLHDDFELYLCDVQRYDAWKDREEAIAELIRDIRVHESQHSPQTVEMPEVREADIVGDTFATAGKRQGMKKLYLLPVVAVIAVLLLVAGKRLLDDRRGDEGTMSSETAVTVNTMEKDSEKEAETKPQTETTAGTEEDTELQAETAAALEDGTYTAVFSTDSSMFHVNVAKDGRGELTVKDGQMTIHVSMVSKNIVNLFPGTAEEAQEDGTVLLEPTTDEVTYSDGTIEEVYGFDIPVPAIGEEFDCAIVGKMGKWYDHKVMVTDPVRAE